MTSNQISLIPARKETNRDKKRTLPYHAPKTLDIPLKPRFNPSRAMETHPQTPSIPLGIASIT